MLYQISFELCAFIILVVVFFHIKKQNRVNTITNRMFYLFAIFGALDILFDMASTIMTENPHIYPVGVQSFALEVFYVLQLIMPYFLYLYVLSLRGALKKEKILYIMMQSMLFMGMLFVVITNPVTELLFGFEHGVYTRGPAYISMYIYAVIYLMVCLIDSIVNLKKIKKKYAVVIWEFIIFSMIPVLIQMVFHEVLLTGVGIAVSLIVLMLTINNPYEKLDSLTGLLDMSALRDALDEMMQIDYRIIVIAMDDLKRVNVVFGMEEGNQILIYLAKELVRIVNHDYVFRFVGDQFVVVCRTEDEYKKSLMEIQALFKKTYHIGEVPLRLSACICGIPKKEHNHDSDYAIDFIDYMIDIGKQKGKGTFLEVDQRMLEEYRRYQVIEGYLYEAVKKDLFEVYYQPVFSTTKKQFVSAEALVRLSHPEFGMISPGEFIPIAERSGEIILVEHCIFHQVCRFMNEHPEMMKTIESIKFNLSPATFIGTNVTMMIRDMIDRYQIDPKKLQFEITETAATVYEDEIIKWAKDMQELGVGLCLDDFGSGYANLDIVTKLPFNIIKMDRSMLVEAIKDEKARRLYKNVVKMMQQIGYEVVAEGAETQEDIRFLEQVKVDLIQGYYYAKPMPESMFLAFK